MTRLPGGPGNFNDRMASITLKARLAGWLAFLQVVSTILLEFLL